MVDERMTRRQALIKIGKAAAGAAVVVAAAAGLAGFYYETRPSNQAVEPGYTSLFDGTLNGWQEAGPGGFNIVDGMLQTSGGMGLLWYTKTEFKDFILKVDWKEAHFSDNSGVFVRFPDPGGDPWSAVNGGYEIQIDNVGAPNGNPLYKTGAVFNFRAPTTVASNPVGQWNYYEIQVVGQNYKVTLNGQVVIPDFVGSRSTVGYIGLQNHDETSTVTFRNIRIKEL